MRGGESFKLTRNSYKEIDVSAVTVSLVVKKICKHPKEKSEIPKAVVTRVDAWGTMYVSQLTHQRISASRCMCCGEEIC